MHGRYVGVVCVGGGGGEGVYVCVDVISVCTCYVLVTLYVCEGIHVHVVWCVWIS